MSRPDPAQRQAQQPMATPTPPKMEVRGVSKTFHARGGEIVALERCDLAIAEGEFVTVVGPSGCG